MKIMLIIGAGSTYEDGQYNGEFLRPPLDKDFFWNFRYDRSLNGSKKEYNSFIYPELTNYFNKNYGYDVISRHSIFNSLEFVLKILFTDINLDLVSIEAEKLLYRLVELLNKIISKSTRLIDINNKTRLVELLTYLLLNEANSDEIKIVTFNYDLFIEKCLNFIKNEFEIEFNFPGCYRLDKNFYNLTKPDPNILAFDINEKHSGIEIYKPHGSLNWFNIFNKNKGLLKYLTQKKNRIKISKRIDLPPELTYQKQPTFPIIVPPLLYKGQIIRKNILKNIWKKWGDELKETEKIIIYGYSLPDNDLETRNMISINIANSKNLKEVILINPDFNVCPKIIQATNFKKLKYYKYVGDYLNEMYKN